MSVRIILKICILFSFILPCLMNNGRKYDMETESLKLYGEDFKSVLRRFRKTPDYLKILNDKMNDIKVYFHEMSLQVLHYYHGKMIQRVNDIIGVTKKFEDDIATTTLPPPQQLYYHAYGGRRQDQPEHPENEESDKHGVKQLDEYKVFDYHLTVAERNSFRDLGFEFSGNLIHAIIHNMGPVESQTAKSTRLPFGGDSDKTLSTTTEHPHTHEVTADSTVGVTDAAHPPPEQTTETFRFRYNQHRRSFLGSGIF